MIWIPMEDHVDGGLWCWDVDNPPPMPATPVAPGAPDYCVRCDPG